MSDKMNVLARLDDYAKLWDARGHEGYADETRLIRAAVAELVEAAREAIDSIEEAEAGHALKTLHAALAKFGGAK